MEALEQHEEAILLLLAYATVAERSYGMSETYVYGIVPGNTDLKWDKMKKVWDACEEACCEVPKVVQEYFGHEPPDPAGIIVELRVTRPSGKEMEDWFEVEVVDIPGKVKTIRFVRRY